MSQWFWSERFWLPSEVQWADFAQQRVVAGQLLRFPQFHELAYSVLAGFALVLVRILVETFLQLPIGICGGWVKLGPSQTVLHACLHHLRHGVTGKSKFKRVAETGWRFTYYTSIWLIGLYVLHDQPQFGDLDNSWRNYPFHNIEGKVWWYYIVQCGFYWSLLFSSFTIDTKRSDFWEMVIHHVVTIGLLSLSWTVNFVRVGTMVLLCHDTADILLEFGKLMRYAGWDTALTVTFVLLFITWVSTRIFVFPVYIISSVMYAAPDMIQKNYVWLNLAERPIVPRVFLAMLLTLLALHCFWTALLIRIAYKSTQKDGEVADIRESSDDSDEDKKRE